jgi:L-cysteine S-thiosulfotransferase
MPAPQNIPDLGPLPAGEARISGWRAAGRQNRARSVYGRAWVWLYIACTGMLALLLLVTTHGGAEQSGEKPMGYSIVDGSIPEPLTSQPGDPERGRRIVLDREGGDCTICHAMPLPQRQFHGTVGPPLDGVASRYTAAELRLRVVDPKAINPETIMPAYYKADGLHRVLDRYRDKPILAAQEVEDIVAYLLTLK